MAKIAAGQVSCGTCHAKGKTKYRTDDGKIHERVCESCYGTLKEKVTPDLRGKMYAELAQYAYPKRKAIELSGEVNGTVTTAEILRSRRQKRLAEVATC